MDELQIKAIIEDCGYQLRLSNRVGRRGDGKAATYVYACLQRRVAHSLGRYDRIAAMNEADLRSLVAAKFAQKKSEVAMSRNDDIDIIGLAAAAKALGYDSPGKVIAGLEYNIKRNVQYLNRPDRQGKPLKFNAEVEERNKILAAAIVLLESLQ